MKKITGLDGVPDFECHEYGGKRAEYCLLIPVINEGERILAELQRACGAGVDKLTDIILCDGGSTDGSTEAARLAPLGVNSTYPVSMVTSPESPL